MQEKTAKKYCFGLICLTCLLAWQGTFAGNVKIHPVETEYQNGKQEIHILLPDAYREDRSYRVLYVLPVEKGFDQGYGYGLGVLEQLDAHNKYDIIIVQIGFEKEPWYGDHNSNLQIRQASYLKEFVVPFIEKHYSAMRAPEGRLLLGFGKSGWGAFSLILRNPEFFAYAASWDAPMFFDEFHYRMEQVYGTSEQLNAYRPDLLACQRQNHFQQKPRLVLAGEQDWGKSIPAPSGNSHTVEMHKLLEKEGIKHVYDNNLKAPHRWNEQWMVPTLEALMGLRDDALDSYKQAVAEAEKLKERIELAEKPWSGHFCITKGQIDIGGDGQKSQIDVFANFGNFWSHRHLILKTPGKPEEVSLYMYWYGQDMYDPPYLRWSKSAEDPAYALEREFIEKIKYAYGYLPEEVILAQPDNPEYAAHFWGKDNGKIEEGRLTIRRYKGKPAHIARELKSPWEDGSLVFATNRHGPLFVYDRQADEHFLLFHCDSKYEEPFVLAKVDPWLLIGLWGEGLVAVDLEDYYLKRFTSFRETVGKIEVTDSEVVIDDGRHRIPLPIERSGEKIRPFYFGPQSGK